MAQDLVHDVIVFFHVIGVITWLIALISTTFTYRGMKIMSKHGEIDEGLIKSGQKMLILELGSLIFVLLTGGALAGRNWFSLETGDVWLTIKQIIYLILLVASIVVVVILKKYLFSGDSSKTLSSDDLLKNVRLKMIISHVFSTLIIVNIFLAFVRPF